MRGGSAYECLKVIPDLGYDLIGISTLMVIVREITKLLKNTLLVLIAVILGFLVTSAMGLPVWLQGFGLLPAAVLFYYLSGDPVPAWWRMIAFFAGLSVYVYLFTLVMPLVPEMFHPLFYMLLLILMPTAPVRRWLDRRFGREAATNAAKPV